MFSTRMLAAAACGALLLGAPASQAADNSKAIYDSCMKHAEDQAVDAYCSCFAGEMGKANEADQAFFLEAVSIDASGGDAAMQATLQRLGMTQEQFDTRMGEVSAVFDTADQTCTASTGVQSGAPAEETPMPSGEALPPPELQTPQGQ